MVDISGFPEVTLKELSSVLTDGSHFSPTPQSSGAPIANVKDLRDGYVDLDSCTRISESAYQQLVASGCTIKPGDVLLSKDGTIGKVVVYEQPNTIVALSSICIIRPRSTFSNRFLGQALQSVAFGKQVAAATSGSALRRLVLREIAGLTVPAPPLAEQYLIAEILDTVDEVIRSTEQVIAKLRLIMRGLLRDLLTVGVDESGELRDPNRHPGQFKETRLGRVPSDWKVGTLGRWLIGRPRNGYSPTEVEETTGWKMLGLGCLTPEGFEPRQLKNAPISDRRLRPFLLHEGDLLLSRSNTRELVGLSGVYSDIGLPCTYPDLMMRVTPTPATSSRFLELLLRSPYVRRQLQGQASGTSGSMVKITGTSVVNLDIAMPQSDEQERILQFLSVAQERMALEIEEAAKLRGLRLGLQEDLLTGRVRVNRLFEGVML
jgi:type I restriction enzyme S subunit